MSLKLKQCQSCERLYYVPRKRSHNNKYCPECKKAKIEEETRNKEKLCPICNHIFIEYRGRKYCSTECSHKAKLKKTMESMVRRNRWLLYVGGKRNTDYNR